MTLAYIHRDDHRWEVVIASATVGKEGLALPAIRTCQLSVEPDAYSPGGVAEIRKLLSFPGGEFTHARTAPGQVSRPSRVFPSVEWFYVLAGSGEIWDGSGEGEVVALVPGRLVRIAPGTPFQYRAVGDTPLDLLLAVMPQWRPEYHGVLDVKGAWDPTGDHPGIADSGGALPIDLALAGLTVHDLDDGARQMAPDGSVVWPMGQEDAGGLALCKLTSGAVTIPVKHRSVEELWYVLDGFGEISRRHDDRDPFIDDLKPGTCVDIGLGLTFQFRCASSEDLVMVLLTMPRWPGDDEAVKQGDEMATWKPTATDRRT